MGFFADLINFLGAWSWWLFGLVLAILEIIVPGTFFIWFAVAAIVTGTIALLFDIGWQAEVLIFVALAASSALLGRQVFGRNRPDEKSNLNDRLNQQVGRLATLETAIVDGSGHIRLDDTLWRVEGPALPAGQQVRIVGHRAGRFTVEPA
ncbi:MAG TPA: NfeD family protein [Methylomirabilota bacterium]|nr:NfeD family protein [Methylomirabilota bacterium]